MTRRRPGPLFLLGARTPWTLESETVWRDTHRLGGRVFVLGGVVAGLSALLPAAVRMWVAMAGFLVAGIVPVVYSYFRWRSEHHPSQG